MKILRKLMRYLPTTRGRIMDMEMDVLEFIDMSQEYELLMRNDLRNLLSALMQHVKGHTDMPSKDDNDDDNDFMYR